MQPKYKPAWWPSGRVPRIECYKYKLEMETYLPSKQPASLSKVEEASNNSQQGWSSKMASNWLICIQEAASWLLRDLQSQNWTSKRMTQPAPSNIILGVFQDMAFVFSTTSWNKLAQYNSLAAFIVCWCRSPNSLLSYTLSWRECSLGCLSRSVQWIPHNPPDWWKSRWS